MTWQQAVENLAAFLLPRIRLVRRVEIPDRHQLQCVENRRLVVVRIALADPGQGPFIVLSPGGVVHRLPILIEHREGLYVVALAAGLRVQSQRPIHSRRALFQFLWRRWRPYRVVPGPRDAPIGHGARRVGFRGIVERDGAIPRSRTNGVAPRRGRSALAPGRCRRSESPLCQGPQPSVGAASGLPGPSPLRRQRNNSTTERVPIPAFYPGTYGVV